MQRIIYTLICFFAAQSLVVAQEATTGDTQHKRDLVIYFGAGVAVTSNYAINDNLAAAGMPEIGGTTPEITLGYNVSDNKVSMDFEINASYSDKKTTAARLKNAMLQVKLRGHYVPYRTSGFYISGGLDVSFTGSQFNLYSRDNDYDLDNLDPSAYRGYVSLNNGQLFAGPSIAIAFFQDKSFPLRFNTGYEWGLTNGKWKSDFGQVSNTVKENGLGRFYAKVVLCMN